MTKIIVNPDNEVANEVKQQLQENGGFCPCRVDKTPDTKCMCKEFRESIELGECHCGLYVRVEE